MVRSLLLHGTPGPAQEIDIASLLLGDAAQQRSRAAHIDNRNAFWFCSPLVLLRTLLVTRDMALGAMSFQ